MLRAQTQKFRISFARPNGATGDSIAAMRGAMDLGGALKAGKTWRQALR
jgi:hypothetical protein